MHARPTGRGSRITYLPDGLEIAARWRTPARFQWTEFVTYTLDLRQQLFHDAAMGSVITTPVTLLHCSTEDGATVPLRFQGPTTRTLASDFSRYGIRRDRAPDREGELAWEVERSIASAQTPNAERAIAQGQDVDFRSVIATPRGIVHGERCLDWRLASEIVSVATYTRAANEPGGNLLIGAYESDPRRSSSEPPTRTWAKVPLQEVVNPQTLSMLAECLR